MIREAPLQALIIDSWFDNYLGVVSLVRVKQARVRKGDKNVDEINRSDAHHYLLWVSSTRNILKHGILEAGEVGFVIVRLKIFSVLQSVIPLLWQLTR